MPAKWTIGIDIGRTNLRAARVEGGVPVKVLRERTDVPGGPRGVVEQVRSAVDELSEGEQAGGLGVGIAGQCDILRGLVRYGPNLWWPDVPFGEMLSSATGLPAVLRNDVTMATFGEWRFGAGAGSTDMVCFYVGTGIGGGAIIGGHLLEGASGCGGHLGHISVQMDGPMCSCGRRGCVEAYAGGANLAARVRQELADDPTISTALRAAGDLDLIDARTVAGAAVDGDTYALEVRDGMAEALSSAVASTINSLNPTVVVLGGPVMSGFPSLFEMVADRSLELCLRSALDGLRIERPSLGDLAGVVGAATLAIR
ncbi:MAG: ROK family protein [Methanomassiliicoccus sp.]|nr:ROK family protein [Methanomassiliicoccus sp.]